MSSRARIRGTSGESVLESGEGNSTVGRLVSDLSFIDPTRRRFAARFRMRSVCGCIVCDHINLHSNLRGWGRLFPSGSLLSLSLSPFLFPSLLFAPRAPFRRSVPIKAARIVFKSVRAFFRVCLPFWLLLLAH